MTGLAILLLWIISAALATHILRVKWRKFIRNVWGLNPPNGPNRGFPWRVAVVNWTLGPVGILLALCMSSQ